MYVMCPITHFKYVSGACGGQKKAFEPLEIEYRWLLATMWVLGTKPYSSLRAASVLNHRDISPHPIHDLELLILLHYLPSARIIGKHHHHFVFVFV